MKIIPLTQGFKALVDDEDYEELSNLKWYPLINDGSIYAIARKNKKNVLMHRLVMNAQVGEIIDHKNNYGLDNRKENLRNVDHATNMQNRRKLKKGSSKYLGVYFHKQSKKYIARIQINGKRKLIGCFDSEAMAAIAYTKFKNKLNGKENNDTLPRNTNIL